MNTNEQMPEPYPLFMPPTLTRELLVFDGLTRAGKGLVAPVLSNLTRVEYAQINNTVDQIAILWKLGLTDTASAAAFLRIAIDTCTYEQAIGRNTNTRITDISSIYNSLDARTLVGRTAGPEAAEAMDIYNEEKRISSYITHFNMPMADLWFTAFPAMRTVITVRHPIDIVASWNSRGWGARWGTDPLGFTPTPAVDGEPMPWFAVHVADAYRESDPVGRNALCVLELVDIYDAAIAHHLNERPEQIETVCFERFATDPMPELERIATWLNTEVPAEIPVIMARERVPRQISLQDRKDKLKMLKNVLGTRMFERLVFASRVYEDHWQLDAVS